MAKKALVRFILPLELEVITDTFTNFSKKDFVNFYKNSDFFLCKLEPGEQNSSETFRTMETPENFGINKNPSKQFFYDIAWSDIDWQNTAWKNQGYKLKIGIGRAFVPQVQMVVNNLSVSKWHGQLIKKSETYLYQDIESTNGTKINYNKIESNKAVPVKSGDVFLFGNTENEFTFLNVQDFYRYLELINRK